MIFKTSISHHNGIQREILQDHKKQGMQVQM